VLAHASGKTKTSQAAASVHRFGRMLLSPHQRDLHFPAPARRVLSDISEGFVGGERARIQMQPRDRLP
jgi:hypothetical protein